MEFGAKVVGSNGREGLDHRAWYKFFLRAGPHSHGGRMQSQSAKEARWWCTQGGKSDLRLARQDVLSYGKRKEQTFRVKNPSEHRMMVGLAHEILTIQSERGFSGGLIWFRMWEVGSPELVKPGWKIIEGMRHAQGDLRSLDIAPAQVFREDERVELHAFLIQMMAF